MPEAQIISYIHFPLHIYIIDVVQGGSVRAAELRHGPARAGAPPQRPAGMSCSDNLLHLHIL